MDTAFPLATALLARDDVSGVMRSAYRRRAGVWVREDCITVGVRKKLPAAELEPDEIIPTTIGGVATDVIELNLKPCLYSERYSVVCGGISIGREVDELSGTMAGVFHDTINNIDVGLTCFHVLAVEGTTPDDPVSYVTHPSGEDGWAMDSTGRIGVTSRWELNEWGDAAIFALTKPAALSQLTSGVVITDVVMPELLDPVTKVGRTTGETNGTIISLGLCDVDYSEFGYGTVTIYMAAFTPVTDPTELIVDAGDSGSLLYHSTSHAGLGLVTSMTSDPVVGYACILGYVLDDLDCDPIFTEKQQLAVTGSTNLAIPSSFSATGSLNVVESGDILSAKVFAINDWETTYGPTDFEVWCHDLGYADSTAFLADAGYATIAEFVASFLTSADRFYLALSTHTSADATEPGIGVDWETRWVAISRPNPWEIDTAYVLNSTVETVDGSFYAAIAAHTADELTEPGVGVDWETAWQLIEIWEAGVSYTIGQAIMRDGEADVPLYADNAAFLADQTVSSLRDVLAGNGIVL